MFFQDIKQGAAVDIVVFYIINRDIGTFGTFITATQPLKLNFGIKMILIYKSLNRLQIFGVATGKAGAAHANFNC